MKTQRCREADTEGEDHAKVETGAGKMKLQAKDCWQPLEASGCKQGLCPRVFRFFLLLLWLQASCLLNCERVNFYCFKPPCLWHFVTAALGNDDRPPARILIPNVWCLYVSGFSDLELGWEEDNFQRFFLPMTPCQSLLGFSFGFRGSLLSLFLWAPFLAGVGEEGGGKNTEVDCHSFLQEIFPTQGSIL